MSALCASEYIPLEADLQICNRFSLILWPLGSLQPHLLARATSVWRQLRHQSQSVVVAVGAGAGGRKSMNGDGSYKWPCVAVAVVCIDNQWQLGRWYIRSCQLNLRSKMKEERGKIRASH